jgi:3-hydroxyacyl-CoA dehydrogenase
MLRKIKKAAVIGSGIMGGGIAALLAAAGVETLLLDIVPMDLDDNEKKDPVARNRIAKAGLDTALMAKPAAFMDPADVARISIGNLEDDFERLSECDWIVEVVVENLKIKQDLFKRVEKIRKADGIVSSNTSGIPLSAMSEGLSDDFKAHFLGTHFFNPVRYMKLLEIIPTAVTKPEVLTFMADFCEKIMGKGVVWAKDTPNFVGNRIGTQGMVNTMQLMLKEGFSIPEIDALFGSAQGRSKTGMFKTADLVGLDTLAHVAKNTYDLVVDDESRDKFVVPEFVNQMLEKKYLGKKTGGGFYKTDLTPEWKRIRKVIDPATLEYVEYERPQFDCLAAAAKAKNLTEKLNAMAYGDDRGSAFVWKSMADNLIYTANRIPEIADTIVEIDNAMRWGFNMEMGPFESWDAIGVAKSIDRMEADGLAVPDKVKQMLTDGCSTFYKTENGQTSFYDFASKAYKPVPVNPKVISLVDLKAEGKTVKSCAVASLVDIGDEVFCLEFHSKMNALSAELIEFASDCIEYVDQNGVGLVIGNQAGGMPGAFSAGADLTQVAEAIETEQWDELKDSIKRLQDGLQRLKYASYPVVAAPYGLTLGGGAEICLASDRVVAHAELYMGLVEVGVGLLPGGGGCLNLFQNFVRSVPKMATDLDLAKFFIPTFMNIAMAKVSMSAAEARINGFLRPTDRIILNRDHQIAEAKKEVLKMVDDGYAPPIKTQVKVIGESAQGMVNVQIMDMVNGKYISEYDAFTAKRIAYVIGGGDVRDNSMVDEDLILTLEREAFVDFCKQEKTVARIKHTLKTGKPLRN